MPTKKSAPALPSGPEEGSSQVNGEVESPPAAVRTNKRKAEEVQAAVKRKGRPAGLAAVSIPEDSEAAGGWLVALEVTRLTT